MNTPTDKCAAYAWRLDAYLLTLGTDAARKAFLDKLAAQWVKDYARYQDQVDSGTYKGSSTAFDFHITMADIDTRRIKYMADPALQAAE